MPGPLISAQKGDQKTTKQKKTPRDGLSQYRVRRENDGGGQESRDWRHELTWDW